MKKFTFSEIKLRFCLIVVFSSFPLFAEMRLPAIFGDHMVLQKKAQVNFWGWADPNETVHIKGSWTDQNISCETKEDGKWECSVLTPGEAGPHEISFTCGDNTKVIKDVLAGEVWICSGQSNMQWTVADSNDAHQEIANASYPLIRLFTVIKNITEEPQRDCNGKWKICSPESIGSFSAVGYYFGRELHKKLLAPIGLINNSEGGTPIESWVRHEVIYSKDDYKWILDNYAKALNVYPEKWEFYKEQYVKWLQALADANENEKPVLREPHPPLGPGHRGQPCGVFNGMVHPLIPFTMQGIIWYHGESNVEHPATYAQLFPELISDWRNLWRIGDFPFLFVQLAPLEWSAPINSAFLREAHLATHLSTPNTGIVVTMDIGDIKNTHPANKQDVGKRLALWALAKIYGFSNIVYSGPIYHSMRVENNKIRLFFNNSQNGLFAKDGKLINFSIAGCDKKFIPAKAIIDCSTVVVYCDEINEPIAVRYAWNNTDTASLFNAEMLPASCFRTDNWN